MTSFSSTNYYKTKPVFKYRATVQHTCTGTLTSVCTRTLTSVFKYRATVQHTCTRSSSFSFQALDFCQPLRSALPKMDTFSGKADPYLVLTVGSVQFRTSVQKNTLAPVSKSNQKQKQNYQTVQDVCSEEHLRR